LSEFSIPVSGAYTNNGQTETFSTPFAFFGATNTGLPTFANNFSLIVSGLLQPSDTFTLSFQASGPLFSPATFVAGQPEVISLGVLDIVNASAGYGLDPAFTGTVDIAPKAPIPEPMTWTFLLVGFGGSGAALRWRRSSAAST